MGLFQIVTPAAFQSTHPVRGATGCGRQRHKRREISIHAPREGCDSRPRAVLGEPVISIHAPREGCDFVFDVLEEADFKISIHAPREGCDGSWLPPPIFPASDFNPRTP